MGTTFVGLGDPRRGFWMNDSLLELWLRFLALHVEDPVESGSLATRVRDQWLLASRGFCTGCVPEGLEEAVSTPEGDALVREAIHSLLGALQAAPSRLNRERAEPPGVHRRGVHRRHRDVAVGRGRARLPRPTRRQDHGRPERCIVHAGVRGVEGAEPSAAAERVGM